MMSPERRRRLGRRLVEWARRYAPLEIFSTITALSGAALASVLTTNAVAIAYAAAWAENVGYYGFALAREIVRLERADAGADGAPRSVFQRALDASKALLWEFGAAEVLDSVIVRPACMYAAVAAFGSIGAGIVAGKIAADIVFYGIAIVFYEWGKRRPIDRA
ncbi:MAG: hypothetical protein AB7L90_06930 [Hyphomicrobiaceae bacterium]